MNTFHQQRWEYRDFTYAQWDSIPTWSALAETDRYLIQQAREYFWEIRQDAILQELNNWQADGWESLDQIGPDALRLQRTEYIKSTPDFSDILLWIMTFGVAFIFQLFTGITRRYVSYRPVELVIRLRRPIPRQEESFAAEPAIATELSF